MGKGSYRHVPNAVAGIDQDMPEGNDRNDMAVPMNVTTPGPFLEVCWTSRPV